MSRVAVISDIHGNAPALKAVLRDAREQGCTSLWFLGDILGYGPLPVSCIHILDAWDNAKGSRGPDIWLMGNHDKGALSVWAGADIEDPIVRAMAPRALERYAFFWHAVQLKVGLDDGRVENLCHAPTWTYIPPGIYAVHGAIIEPDVDSLQNIGANAYCVGEKPYVVGNMLKTIYEMSERNPDLHSPSLILVGHTHIPTWARVSRNQHPLDWEWQSADQVYTDYLSHSKHKGVRPILTGGANDDVVTIVCPGSVGHRPTEDDTVTAYVVLTLDEGTQQPVEVEFRRLPYETGEYRAALALFPPPETRIHDLLNWWRSVSSILKLRSDTREMQ